MTPDHTPGSILWVHRQGVLREMRDAIVDMAPDAQVMIDGRPLDGDNGIVHKDRLLAWFEKGGRFEVRDATGQ